MMETFEVKSFEKELNEVCGLDTVFEDTDREEILNCLDLSASF